MTSPGSVSTPSLKHITAATGRADAAAPASKLTEGAPT
jgi:hypothetical protein